MQSTADTKLLDLDVCKRKILKFIFCTLYGKMELKIVLDAACFRMDMLTKGHDMGLYEKNTSKSPPFIVFTVKNGVFVGL